MNGALLVDKPAGLTSHDVVSRIRRLAGTRRVGHAGTLDPFATGLLVVCVGRATRLVQYLVGLDKEYVATVRLGFATDTHDLTGTQTTATVSAAGITEERLREGLRAFEGPQLQIPPMFSAKKVAGERLYRAARQGRQVQRAPVPIEVFTIELAEPGRGITVHESGLADFVIRVRCSSGTYVRTLAHDLGMQLGTGGHLAGLRRVSVGHLTIANARSLEDLERLALSGNLDDALLSPCALLRHLPRLDVDDDRKKRVACGREFAVSLTEAESLETDCSVRLCTGEDALIAVGDYDISRQCIRPRVVLVDTA